MEKGLTLFGVQKFDNRLNKIFQTSKFAAHEVEELSNSNTTTLAIYRDSVFMNKQLK